MDVVRLVVEPERGRARRAETQVGLRDLHRDIEGGVIPNSVDDGREVLRTGVGLLAATVLVLQLEAERLAGVEPVERAVERRRLGDAQRGRDRGRGAVELEQWCEWRLGLAAPREPHPAGGPCGPPTPPPGGDAGRALAPRPPPV